MSNNITNQTPEAALQDFESILKAGIIKQLERKGLLTAAQSALLVEMQWTERAEEHGRSVR